MPSSTTMRGAGPATRSRSPQRSRGLDVGHHALVRAPRARRRSSTLGRHALARERPRPPPARATSRSRSPAPLGDAQTGHGAGPQRLEHRVDAVTITSGIRLTAPGQPSSELLAPRSRALRISTKPDPACSSCAPCSIAGTATSSSSPSGSPVSTRRSGWKSALPFWPVLVLARGSPSRGTRRGRASAAPTPVPRPAPPRPLARRALPRARPASDERALGRIVEQELQARRHLVEPVHRRRHRRHDLREKRQVLRRRLEQPAGRLAGAPPTAPPAGPATPPSSSGGSPTPASRGRTRRRSCPRPRAGSASPARRAAAAPRPRPATTRCSAR